MPTSVKVTRWVVRVVPKDGRIMWVTQGTGFDSDFTKAYIYANKHLADAKAARYNKFPQWYQSAEVLEVVVDFIFTATIEDI